MALERLNGNIFKLNGMEIKRRNIQNLIIT